MKFVEETADDDDIYTLLHSENYDIMKRVLAVFDSSATIRIVVESGVIRFFTRLSSTSNSHTVLCMHLKDLPIITRHALNILVRVSLLGRIYKGATMGSKWRWSLEDDAIGGIHNLVMERLDANADSALVHKIAVKREENGSGDPDLEIGIPERIITIASAKIHKLLNLLVHWGKRSKWITIKAEDKVSVEAYDELMSFSMTLEPEQPSAEASLEVAVDCKQLYKSLLPVKLASHSPVDVTLGISSDALTVKVNQAGKWTCASILAIRLSD